MTNTNYPSANNPQGERPVKNTNNSNTTKNILIGVLAVGLLGTWAYFLYDKNQGDKQYQAKSMEATSALSARDSVQAMYDETLARLDSITGDNNNLKGDLSDRESDITKLRREIDQIMRKRNATEAELRRAKSLIVQLNEKIANLEADNARLIGENAQLASTTVVLTQEKQTLESNLQQTATEKEELARTVDVGSTFTAANIQIKPLQEKKGGKEKETSNAKRVDKLLISFDVENRIAKSGPADIYVIVTGPNGQVINEPGASGVLTTRNEGDKPFTFKTSIEYEQGTRRNIQVPLRQNNFQTGDYRIEIYQNGFKIAEGIRSLKKGGLFG